MSCCIRLITMTHSSKVKWCSIMSLFQFVFVSPVLLLTKHACVCRSICRMKCNRDFQHARVHAYAVHKIAVLLGTPVKLHSHTYTCKSYHTCMQAHTIIFLFRFNSIQFNSFLFRIVWILIESNIVNMLNYYERQYKNKAK